MRFFCYVMMLGVSGSLFAWNANGHVVISQLAYQDLSPKTQQWVTSLLGPDMDLDRASIWMDQVKGVRQMHRWHYVNLPYGDKRYFPKLDPINALVAIEYSRKTLANKDSNQTDKRLALLVLIHVIEDIHQPMHTISWYSRSYPYGDKGGNAWRMRYGNLHSFWDSAGGWLKRFTWNQKPGVAEKLQELKGYHCNWQQVNLDPKLWVEQSHQLAIKYAYFPPRQKYKFLKYTQITQQVAKRQMRIAACHLTAMLNALETQCRGVR